MKTILFAPLLLLSVVTSAQQYRYIGYRDRQLSQDGIYYMADTMRAYFSGGNPGNYQDYRDTYDIYSFYYHPEKVEVAFKADSIVINQYVLDDGELTYYGSKRTVNQMSPLGDVQLERYETLNKYGTHWKYDHVFENCSGLVTGMSLIEKSDGETTPIYFANGEWNGGLLTRAYIKTDQSPYWEYGPDTWASSHPASDHRIDHIYLADGRLSVTTVSRNINYPNTAEYEVFNTITYTYNDDGTLASIFDDDLYYGNYDVFTTYTYDAEGRLIKKIIYKDAYEEFPDAYEKNTYTYDAEGNLIQDLQQRFRNDYDIYVNENRRDYTYDDRNLCITEAYYTWKDTVWVYGYERFNYYEVYDPSDTLLAIDMADDILQVYPNPVSCCAAVIFQAKADGPANVVLYDITGREMYQTTVNAVAGKNYFTLPLDELRLRNAVYIISVLENGNVHSSEFIKY